MPFMIRMIAACARDRVMGAGGTLPWKIKKDWDYFLETTRDGALVMGRKCYEDFTGYAGTRPLVVLSRDPQTTFRHAQKASSLRDGLNVAEKMAGNIWICGGAEIYQEAMPIARELYLTQIDAHYEGDVRFPPWEPYFTREISRQETIADGHKISFLILGK